MTKSTSSVLFVSLRAYMKDTLYIHICVYITIFFFICVYIFLSWDLLLSWDLGVVMYRNRAHDFFIF